MRKCIFCGNNLLGRKTKEHIVPMWLQKAINHPTSRWSSGVINVSGNLENVRNYSLSAYVSGHVCGTCNSGWMSDLESQAKPILIRLIDDNYRGSITLEECRILTKWTFKTALARDSVSQTKHVIPKSHYEAFHIRGNMPGYTRVSIAKLENYSGFQFIVNGNWRVSENRESNDTLRDLFENSYRVTMCFGCLATRIHYWPHTDWSLFEYFRDCIQDLWPPAAEGIDWPPSNTAYDIHEVDSSLVLVPPF